MGVRCSRRNFSLSDYYLKIVRDEAGRRGTRNMSQALRHIIGEWNVMRQAQAAAASGGALGAAGANGRGG